MTGQSRSIRAMRILEAVARADRPLRASEIMSACDLPRATVHRICGLLTEQGYLSQQQSSGGYVPGSKLVHFAHSVQASQAQNSLQHAILETVARQTGETCNLARPDGTAMVYLDRVETEWPLKVQMPIGTRVPLYCTASGKMYMSSLPAERRGRLISTLELETRTPNSITDPNALERELESVAEKQVSTDNQEFSESMVAVAVPVKDAKGRLFATLSIHAPVFRMTLKEALSYSDLLREAANELSADTFQSDSFALHPDSFAELS